ncbi:phosphatase PAP2 family protein [Streptomyces boncukensis]|uniref:PAP2 family protein n=1 Tax=Streptomyces boncukensis TaxID=2711219 RepID=A0A6G4X850_9ACTN|nr:phosphatase PAP2 family protein [Streptomyces boncukensis]NGO72924.1 PAP2 family protein [Streptomyces boncukensis]
MPTDRRLRWWTELPLVIVVYALYSAGRLLARGNESTAVANGLDILRLERRLNIDAETPLNHAFVAHAWLGVPADFAYASLHYLVTPAVLIWLFRRRPAQYRFARTWLTGSTLIGLAGFTLMPTCPPRLLDPGHGFTDAMEHFSRYGWWGGDASAPRGLGGFTNQFAAMPSLHVGWALWCAVVVWLWGPRTVWCRALAAAYPAVITVSVMGTANHYLLDAVAGAAVMGVGWLLARPLLRLADRIRDASARRIRRGTGGRATFTRATHADEPGDIAGPDGGGAEGTGTQRANGSPPAPDVTGGCQTAPGTAIPSEAPADESADEPADAPVDAPASAPGERRRLPGQRRGTAPAGDTNASAPR